MATKKFSRLSVMLEAKDGMSASFLKAARSSQTLQNSISKLDSSLSNSSKMYNRTNQMNHDLEQGYRALAQRLGQTTQELTLSERMFNRLPRSMQTMIFNLKYLGDSFKRVVQNSLLFKASSAVLTGTIRGVVSAVSLLGRGLASAGSSIYTFTGLRRTVSALAGPVRSVASDLKTFFGYMADASGVPGLWRMMRGPIQQIGMDIRLNTRYLGVWLRTLPALASNTRVVQGLNLAFQNLRNRVVAGATAFTIWRNASPTMQTISNRLSSIGNVARRVFSVFRLGRRDVDNADNEMGRLGNRRSTFNQLADANARLNRQIQQMNRRLGESNGLLGKMGEKIKTIAGLEKLRAGIEVGQTVYDKGKDVLSEMVNGAAEQQMNTASFGIILGNQKKGADYYKTIQNYAATTAYSASDWAGQLKGVVKRVKNTKQLTAYMNTIEQLATLMPQQGLEGAAFAMRELSGGQITSLANRFDIAKSYLKPLKKIKDPNEQAAALSKILGDKYGYSYKAINMMKQQPQMQMVAVKTHIKTAMGLMGQGILKQISPEMEKFNKLYDEGKFDKFIKSVSNGLGKATKSVIDFINKIVSGFGNGKMSKELAPFKKLGQNIVATLQKNWPKISSIFKHIGSIAVKIVKDINNHWGTISGVFSKVVSALKSVSSFVDKHYGATRDLVLSLGAAFVGFKVAMGIGGAVSKVIKLWKELRRATVLATAAQVAFDIALDANPIGLIALAIEGLIAVGVLLALNWKKVEKVMTSVWDGIKYAAQGTINWIIGGINRLIGAIDKIPGIHIGKLGMVSWTGSANVKVNKTTQSDWKNTTLSNQKLTNKNSARNASLLQSPFAHSHRTGKRQVPYDGYQAVLHKNERVLTAKEASKYNTLEDGSHKGQVLVTGNTFIVRQDSDIDEIASALYDKLYKAKTAMGGAS